MQRISDPKVAFRLNLIGTVAAIISSISLLPQVFDVYTTNNVDGLSLSTLILICITTALWILYHLQMGTYPALVSATFNFAFSAMIIYKVLTLRDKTVYVPFREPI